jgi:hypothetical protein
MAEDPSRADYTYAAVKSVVETLRAKVAQQIYITAKCKFLIVSKFFNWTNKTCFGEEFPLGSLGSKKLATSESSFTRFIRLPMYKFCGLKPASRHHNHDLSIVKIYTGFT